MRTQDRVSRFSYCHGTTPRVNIEPLLVTCALSDHIQELVSQCMFFADDIILVEDLKYELNENLEILRQTF
ncbi:hypothetical protein Lal_00049345 [Lupinus albus]|nr:hypothetical protein Lal_00049345 [Lupinus albus]